jgi:hypothetical protein
MLQKIFFYSSLAAMGINVVLFGIAYRLDNFELQLLSLANIFLLNFIFLRE